MLVFNDILYILGSQKNEIQLFDTKNDVEQKVLSLQTGGFSFGLTKIQKTNLAVVTDLKNNYYSIIDLVSGNIIKTYSVNVPIKDVIITDKVRLFD